MFHPLTGRVLRRFLEQWAGFLAFPLINAVVWVGLAAMQDQITRLPPASSEANFLKIVGLLLPWVINGAAVVAAFFFSRYIGIGYLAFIVWAIVAVTLVAVLFIPACLVAVAVGWGVA